MKRTTDSILLPDATSCSVASNVASLSTARLTFPVILPRGQRNIAGYSAPGDPREGNRPSAGQCVALIR
ncbi:hypothetical protein [Leifsonia aquatica]|uniref:hypothetical protein n=1 Tax=Leifsonia aquatica TaxID=144185 RepID=UPI0037F54AD0